MLIFTPMRYKSILLIDDDTDDHEIFKAALESLSTPVTFMAISRAREALRILEAGELTPDVILLDLNMPVMSGQQFLQEIKKKDLLKSIPVIIFSTTSNQTTIDATKKLGAIDFITKPTKFDELTKTIRTIITA